MAIPNSALRPFSRGIFTAPCLLASNALRTATRSQKHVLGCRPPSLSAPSSPLRVQIRYSSYNSPDPSPNVPNARKKVTMQTLKNLYKKGEPIAMLTAHDFPSAHAADVAGIDVVLVGDSLGMVALGLDNTTEVVMDEMILHCRSVVRGAKSAFIVSCAVVAIECWHWLTILL